MVKLLFWWSGTCPCYSFDNRTFVIWALDNNVHWPQTEKMCILPSFEIGLNWVWISALMTLRSWQVDLISTSQVNQKKWPNKVMNWNESVNVKLHSLPLFFQLIISLTWLPDQVAWYSTWFPGKCLRYSKTYSIIWYIIWYYILYTHTLKCLFLNEWLYWLKNVKIIKWRCG